MAQTISVSALNTYVRSILESDQALSDIAVQGEVSNFSRNFKTGHCYFSLKDGKATIKAVMFRSDAQRMGFSPENGMQVVARGRVTLYERDGTFQLSVEFMFPDGQGASQLAFEQLRKRLESSGLFAQELKKTLPPFPNKVGLITSKTGAALQDILNIAQRRCPLASFVLAPVAVQGAAAVDDVAFAIAKLDASNACDVIIVARGGGSAEDLWVFNAEKIAQAAFACKTPLVSAIGHEVDYTILDYVADLRAPTPSAAAELTLPNLQARQLHMLHIYSIISQNILQKQDSCYNKMQHLKQQTQLGGVHDKIIKEKSTINTHARFAVQQIQQNLITFRQRAQHSAALAAGLNPYAVLARGYAAVQNINNIAVSSVHQLKPHQLIDVVLQDGTLQCEVHTIKERQVSAHNEEKS